MINEPTEAPGSWYNAIQPGNSPVDDQFYDGPFDFTFYRRDQQNFPKNILQDGYYGHSLLDGA